MGSIPLFAEKWVQGFEADIEVSHDRFTINRAPALDNYSGA